jgi:hypothetical protein
MKTQLSRISCIALTITAALAGSQRTQAQGTIYSTFTYQGRLDDLGGGQLDQPVSLRITAVIPPFPCFGTDCGWFTNCPDCLRIELGTNSVLVNKGLFTTAIVIPPPLLSNSNGLYLQFGVRTNGGGDFTALWPAQQVTATPYASIAQSVSGPIEASNLVGTMPTGMLTGIFSSPLNLSNPGNIFAGDGSLLTHIQASNLIGTMPTGMLTGIFNSPVTFNNPSNVFVGDGSLLTRLQAGNLVGTMPTGMLTGVFSSPVTFNNPSNIFAGDGSLLTHVNATTIGGLDPCNLPCYWNVLGNIGTDPNVNFLGTSDNVGLTIRVANLPAMRINRSGGPVSSPDIIGGDSANSISGGNFGSVIGGGGSAAFPNSMIGADFSVIGGGLGNHIEDQGNTIAGGSQNRIDHSTSLEPEGNFIGGGLLNSISGIWSTISGGDYNRVDYDHSTIGGGELNQVDNNYGTIGGGTRNQVGGYSSVVAGGWGNNVSAPYSAISGGSGNAVLGETSTIGGGSVNQIGGVSGPGRASFIGAGAGNRIYAPGGNIPSDFDVIAGGNSNLLIGSWSVIAGGGYNSVLTNNATLSGGYYNAITVHGHLGTVGGGANNYVDADSATISGGFNNYVGGDGAFIGGGSFHSAYGAGATIPGGITNAALGYASFAAGNRAKAMHDGAFVWSDSQNADFASTANNQFAVRAQNGVMIQGTATTLDLRGDGAIRVAGAGVGSAGPVFIHRASNANISGHITTIDHPLANGDPNAILIVTHNFSADTSGTPYEPNAVGVWYNGSRWTIYHENTAVAMPVGRAFNVMIIKP